MRLGDKQQLFARLLPKLLIEAHAQGFDIRLGEILRFEQQARYNSTHCRKCKQTKANRAHALTKAKGGHRFRAIGILNSLHRQKLAIDLNLFRDGRLCAADEYTPLGEWWERLHELAANGRKFGDAGHFSLTHKGRK